jgi:DNA-binding LacI/PurR family transcriptional regulator
VAHHFHVSGDRATSIQATREATASLVEAGVTAILVHAADDVHNAVLAELTDRGLSVPGDISVVSVAASFDTGALALPVDVIPLLPEPSCDLAVDLAVRSLSPDRPEPGLHLIPPVYYDRGSVAPPRDRR